MFIALLAHNNKRDLLVQFCSVYSGILRHHILCSTKTDSCLIMSGTGLIVHSIDTDPKSIGHKVGAHIACNELDVVLYFTDEKEEKNKKDFHYISELCAQNNIPFASNLATAELLLLGIERRGI